MTKNVKILLTGVDLNKIFEFAKYVSNKNDNIIISKLFTTDIDYKGVTNENYYFLDINVINISYKNNALLCTYTTDNITTGITIDDMYNSNILPINIWHFNNISTAFFNKSDNYDILVVWLDSKHHDILTNLEMIEIGYMNDLLINTDSIKYMYFLDEDYDNIYSILEEYVNSDINRRNELLEENN